MAVNHPPAADARERTLGKEYFENLFNQVPEAIVIADNVGRIIRVNGEFSRMFGFSRQEVVGRPVDDLLAPGEVAGSYMISLVPGVDAEALARYLARERQLRVAVSTPRYLTLRGSDEDAAAVACLGGVQRVVRDVEGKKD